MKQTRTTIWASGSIVDIQSETFSMEEAGWCVHQIALFPAPTDAEPMFDGFIVYERDGD